MNYSILLPILAFAVALCISLYRRYQQKRQERRILIQNIQETICKAVAAMNQPHEDDTSEDEQRKKEILEKIKKIGIFQCDKQNLHLR